MNITTEQKKPKKENYFVGDYLQVYYDCLRDEVDPSKLDLPRRELSYITTLLSEKFGRKFSYQEVEKLLKAEKLL